MNDFREIVFSTQRGRLAKVAEAEEKVLRDRRIRDECVDRLLVSAKEAFDGLKIVVTDGLIRSKPHIPGVYGLAATRHPANYNPDRPPRVAIEAWSGATDMAGIDPCIILAEIRVEAPNSQAIAFLHPSAACKPSSSEASLKRVAEWIGETFEVLPPVDMVSIEPEHLRTLLLIAGASIKFSGTVPDAGTADALASAKFVLARHSQGDPRLE